jgi:hypothetical protein
MPSERPASVPAVGVFLAGSLSFLPLARALRFATLELTPRPARAALIAALALAVAFAHERVVRGGLYGALRSHLSAGFPAVFTALAGAFVPLGARLILFPVPGVSGAVVATHAAFVEIALSLGICWVALGTRSTLPGVAALGTIWAVRAFVVVSFRGGAVPAMELFAALAGGWLVAWTLRSELEPHRAAMMGD